MTQNLALTTTQLTNELESRIGAIASQTTLPDLVQIRRAVEPVLVNIDATAITNLTNAIQTRINGVDSSTSLTDLLLLGVLTGKTDYDIAQDIATLLTRTANLTTNLDAAVSSRATPQNILDSQGVITTAISNIPTSGPSSDFNLVPLNTVTGASNASIYQSFSTTAGAGTRDVEVINVNSPAYLARLVLSRFCLVQIFINGTLKYNLSSSTVTTDTTKIDAFGTLTETMIPPLIASQSLRITIGSGIGGSCTVSGLYLPLEG